MLLNFYSSLASSNAVIIHDRNLDERNYKYSVKDFIPVIRKM